LILIFQFGMFFYLLPYDETVNIMRGFSDEWMDYIEFFCFASFFTKEKGVRADCLLRGYKSQEEDLEEDCMVTPVGGCGAEGESGGGGSL
jgi:hypothetical protein